MADKIEFTFDDKAIQDRLKILVTSELPELINNALLQATLYIEAEAKKNLRANGNGLKTGLLRDSITHTIDEASHIGYVGSNLDYAIWVHQGTGIYALNGDGRKTPWAWEDAKGELHFTHGMKPNPFIQKAIDENKDNILKFFEGLM